MYGFLFDQTYINLIILGFFLFLIMFLWRKITIIEGNYFILEKRVDMFKKTERDHLISKNIEKADIVMNEIFKDSTGKKGGYCNNINYCTSDGKTQKQSDNQSASITEQDIDTEEQTVDISKYINIINTPEVPNDIKNKIEIIDTEYKEQDINIDTSAVEEDVKVISQISSVINKNLDDTEENRGINNDIMDVINITTGDNLDNDAVSISSDITFGSDHDKSITKKYKKMSIEKLREECIEKSLNAEGSKAILIARILEYNKKS